MLTMPYTLSIIAVSTILIHLLFTQLSKHIKFNVLKLKNKMLKDKSINFH